MKDQQLDNNPNLDRLLHALTHPAPRPGMEARVLRKLEHTVITPKPSFATIALRFAIPTATAAIAAIVVTLILTHRTTPANTAAPSVAMTHAPTTTTPALTPALHHATSRATFTTAAFTQPESREVDATYLPSFPAPTAPLTASERALQRAARHTQTIDVARLEEPSRSDQLVDYLHHMLSPLVTAESFHPTAPTATEPAPPSEPESSSTDTPQ